MTTISSRFLVKDEDDNTLLILCDEGEGKLTIQGAFEEAAFVLFDWVMKQNSKCLHVNVNNMFRIHLSPQLDLEWIGEKEPDSFQDLRKAFKRYVELGMFW